MKIGFIGAGNVGFSLGKYFKSKNLDVLGYYSLFENDAKEASMFTNTECYSAIEDIANCCDTLFLTVNDDGLAEIINELKTKKINNKILIHTSGAKSSKIFGELNDNNYCYSLHPIYAFNDKYASYKKLDSISFTLEGRSQKINEIKSIIESLGNKVAIIDSDNKVKYHAACVMMSNMVCGIINKSFDLLDEIGIDNHEIFNSLIQNNVDNILNSGPVKALTGPVVRNDIGTIESHLDALNNDELYKLLSLELIKMSKEKTNNDYKEMEELLEEKV